MTPGFSSELCVARFGLPARAFGFVTGHMVRVDPFAFGYCSCSSIVCFFHWCPGWLAYWVLLSHVFITEYSLLELGCAEGEGIAPAEALPSDGELAIILQWGARL